MEGLDKYNVEKAYPLCPGGKRQDVMWIREITRILAFV